MKKLFEQTAAGQQKARDGRPRSSRIHAAALLLLCASAVVCVCVGGRAKSGREDDTVREPLLDCIR